ncbi:hypothetical protein EDI_259560 [Entamoeba dispar SAW760]|uniref:TLDc domain-containing protein n=1 Tax=Entamoeba dispar (strain ATCC PRA-260 / SAW760) TaxID=370354 RepID=B0EB75_ENTDS|nr:uncharacterized protein EDI_259560 [Entamoeba dispar SAW760]EDR28223.1 hypothetical protein EDI_259560 [Entamoeba dispar SAW760]|eukprot:EDR28223.1 hypothetical protein EDI_259560 [Entamoeba dispar SAW760]
MDIDVLIAMSTDDSTRLRLEQIREQYNSLVPVVNNEYVSFCTNVFTDSIDSETPDQMNHHLNDISFLRRKKQESVAAISKLLDRFGSFNEMKVNDTEQLKVLDDMERRIRERLSTPIARGYQPNPYEQQNPPSYPSVYPQDIYQQGTYPAQDNVYESKPIKRYEEIGEYPPRHMKIAKTVDSERPITDPLVNNAMSKIFKRVKKSTVKCIFDSDVDGWDRAAFTDIISGFSSVMIIVSPVDDRVFGCYIDTEIHPHRWNGGECSFLCALHGNDFFWVHGYNKGVPKDVDLLKIGEPNEDVFFYFTKYISFQANKGLKKSHFDAKILEIVQPKPGTFIGDGITKYFELRKFIVLHFS